MVAGSSALPRRGVFQVFGDEGSVNKTRPVAVTYGNHRCETEEETWRHLISRVSDSLGVEDPNRYRDWRANRLREEIVSLINRHTGIRPRDIVFEVHDR
ncbi:MAG: hypothetical protein OXN17_15465 [Candidatus Poribacteria bacterium]|nr:hypothetical protein [Candidatus Poribacteria bacterium]